jgi:hypothetical protein
MNFSGKNDMPRKTIFLLALFSALGVVAYVLAAAWFYRPGFPLDDSWIHLTYARNLALLGEWSFLPGQSSAGSTSPLWTFLLAIGFFLPGSPYLWTYFLGGLMLFLLAWRFESTLRQLQPAYRSVMPWAGLLIVCEWRLAWSAASGMETLLHAFLSLLVLSFLILNQPRFLLIGILVGLSVWSRPDGITLLGPVGLFALLQPLTRREKFGALGLVLLGFALLFIPYLFFNLILAGTPWPNTFYAKQAEYAFWQAEPWPVKLWEFATTYFIGTALVLLPAVLIRIFDAVQKRSWGVLLSFIWLVGYIAIYTTRLPLYQYGRYLMPTIPIFLLLGMGFLVFWLPVVRTHAHRRLRFAWLTLIGLLGFVFWGYGAYFFAQNVSWIESEMVQTARWTAQNLPPDAQVAVHDIGALGYYDSKRKIIDLAGLISPDVIPFIRDEEKLAQYLLERGATHLIIFPDWYPILASDCHSIFEADGPSAGQSELGKMTVYNCQKP